jgi:hypothetical protein
MKQNAEEGGVAKRGKRNMLGKMCAYFLGTAWAITAGF